MSGWRTLVLQGQVSLALNQGVIVAENEKHMNLETSAELFLLEAMKAVKEGGTLPEVRFD